MKFLGFMFLLALLLAAVGYFRGWFSITTSDASGKSGVELTIDNQKLGDDAKAVTRQRPAATTEPEGSAATTDGSEVEGVLAAVDVAARNLTVTVGSQRFVQHVATAVPISRSGVSIGLDELRAKMRAKLVFDHANEPRGLLRIEILP
jgi:hypothetical protein